MKIKDLAIINPKSIATSEFQWINYIDTSSVLDGKLMGIQRLAHDFPSRAQRTIRKNDLLISAVRPILKHNYFVRCNIPYGIASTGFIQIRLKDNAILPQFLYFFLTTEEKITHYQTMAETSQSTFPCFNKDVIAEMEFPLISASDQQHIVDILGSIDDKIENNEKIICSIRQIMTKQFMLFYEMIKNNPQEKIGSLPIIVSDFVANGSFAALKENVFILEDDGYAYFLRNMDLKVQNFNKYVNKHTYDFLSKSLLKGNEVLISNVGDVGSVFLCPLLDKPMTLGNNMIFLNSNENDYYNFYLYYLFLSEVGQKIIDGITGGSAQPKFNKTDFRSISIPKPTKNELSEFNDSVTPYVEKTNSVNCEIKKLNELKQLYLKKFFG